MNGLSHSERIKKKITQQITGDLKAGRLRRNPKLIAICVGDNPSSQIYVRMKKRACEECNILSEIVYLPKEISTEELLEIIDQFNHDKIVSGILVQHPLPEHIDTRVVFDKIALQKDVDGVSSISFGRSSFGVKSFPACTAAGIIELLAIYSIGLAGKHLVVVGRSPILGRPVAMLGLNANATVTICHSKSKNVSFYTQQADIVIAACGQPQMIHGDWLKAGVVVIDAGYNSSRVGDVDFKTCKLKASHITPVPGGVGPMTIAFLLKHTYFSEYYRTD